MRARVVVPRDLAVNLRPVNDGDYSRDSADGRKEQRERGQDQTDYGQ